MIRILIDPGHAWNANRYPSLKDIFEGTQMWKLGNYLQPELEKRGFYVENVRPNLKDFVDVNLRGKLAKGFDLVVSLHSNAPGPAAMADGTYYNVRGTVIIYSLSSPKIKPLADAMGKRIASLMDHRYRGSITMESESKDRIGQDRNAVLRNAARVGCKAGLLVEHGFHTNAKDAAFLAKDENLKKLAIAEADAIAEYYGKGLSDMNYLESTVTLYRGLKNDYVAQLQEDLMEIGYDLSPHGADGSFGARTETVVLAFQKDNGLQVDGRFGPASKRKMKELLESKKAPAPTKDIAEIEARLKKAKDLAREYYNKVMEV